MIVPNALSLYAKYISPLRFPVFFPGLFLVVSSYHSSVFSINSKRKYQMTSRRPTRPRLVSIMLYWLSRAWRLVGGLLNPTLGRYLKDGSETYAARRGPFFFIFWREFYPQRTAPKRTYSLTCLDAYLNVQHHLVSGKKGQQVGRAMHMDVNAAQTADASLANGECQTSRLSQPP